MKKIYIGICFFSCIFWSISCMKVTGDYNFQNQEHVYNGLATDYLKSKAGIYDSLLVVLERLPAYTTALEAGDVTLFAVTNSSFQLAITNLNLVRQNQGKSALSLRTVALNELDMLMSRYLMQHIVSTEEMENKDGVMLLTKMYSLENENRMHTKRIKEQSSGFVDGGLVRVLFSDTKYSTFENQWVSTGTQAVNIRSQNCIMHILENSHEFGFGEFLSMMNK